MENFEEAIQSPIGELTEMFKKQFKPAVLQTPQMQSFGAFSSSDESDSRSQDDGGLNDRVVNQLEQRRRQTIAGSKGSLSVNYDGGSLENPLNPKVLERRQTMAGFKGFSTAEHLSRTDRAIADSSGVTTHIVSKEVLRVKDLFAQPGDSTREGQKKPSKVTGERLLEVFVAVDALRNLQRTYKRPKTLHYSGMRPWTQREFSVDYVTLTRRAVL